MNVTARSIAACFNRVFADFHVRMLGGASEPLYIPLNSTGTAELHYTADYAASALHEAAHWCLAGARRRRMPDFGFHYVPSSQRSEQDQLHFECSEVQTQAIEWFFALSCGLSFRLSIDHLSRDRSLFKARVLTEARRRLQHGLPPRAEIFRYALAMEFSGGRHTTLTWCDFVASAQKA